MGWVVGPPQSGGMEAVVWLLAKQQVQGPQPTLACFMQIPASESLLFLFFPSQKRQILARFGEAVKPAY